MPDNGTGPGGPPAEWPMEQSEVSSSPPGGDGDPGPAAEAFLNEALDHHDREQYDEAIRCYQKAIEIDPGLVVAHNNLGMVWIDKGMFKEAVASLERAVELDPSYAEAYNNLGFAWRRLGDEPRAAAYYQRFLELESDVEDAPKIRTWIEQVKAKHGGLPPVGKAAASAPLAPAPPPAAPPGTAQPTAAAARGGSWLDQIAGGEAAAPAAPPQARREETSAEALCEKGIAEFERGNLAAAEAELRRAVAMNPRLALARSALGRVLARAGRNEEAVAELRQAISLDPADAAAYYVLGFALRELRRDAEAAEAYEKYLELTPDSAEGPQIRAWVAEVRAAAQISPEELYHRAFNAFQEGALDDALELCEHIIALEEGHVSANILLGRILIQKGDYLRAVPALKRAERAKPDNPEVHFYLGQAYEKRGLMDEARAAYEKCLSVAPAGPRAESIRKWLEKASGRAPAAGVRCEYCFRSFPAEKLSTRDGKKICPDCLANLEAAVAPQQVASALQPTVVERAAAEEAERERRERARAALRRRVLVALLAALMVFGVFLLFLRYGWLEGPFQRIGVYRALRWMGLDRPLERLGIVLPAPPPPTGPPAPSGPRETPPGKRPPPPQARPLVARAPSGLLTVAPFGELRASVLAEGGKGGYKFRLRSGPRGASVDAATGAVVWRLAAPAEGPEAVEPGSRHEFEVEVSSGDETAAARFAVAVHFGLRAEPPVDVGAAPGDQVLLAACRAGGQGGSSALVAASGRYRRGRVCVIGSDARGGARAQAALGGVPSAIAVADLDGDGREDVAVSDWFARRVVVFRMTEPPGLEERASISVRGAVDDLCAGDVDGDGKADLVASHWSAGVVSVLLQRSLADGRRGLSEPAEYSTGKPSGWNRVFVGPLEGGAAAVYLIAGSGDDSPLKAFKVLREGHLASYVNAGPAAPLPGLAVDARMLRRRDAPPRLALLFGGDEPRVTVLAAKGEGLDVAASPRLELGPCPLGMAVGDLTGDGSDDMVVVSPEEIRVFLNGGGSGELWKLSAVAKVPGGVGPAAVGDFTGDGRADVAVVLDDGRVQVLRSTAAEEGPSP